MPSRNTPWTNVTHALDTSSGSIAKSFTASTSDEWHIRCIYANLTAGAVTGNRLLEALVVDNSASSRTVAQFRAGATLSSASSGTVQWAAGLPNDTAFTSGFLHRGLPADLEVVGGYKLVVQDANAVSTLDHLDVHVLYDKFTI